MKPVDQRQEHDPPRSVGDCHAACIASLLELPLSEVPAIQPAELEEQDLYWRRLARWLADRGLHLVKLRPKEEEHWSSSTCADDNEYWIGVGPSARGNVLHCVIFKGAEMVHDPHPSRIGLVDVHDVEYLVRLNPVATREVASSRHRQLSELWGVVQEICELVDVPKIARVNELPGLVLAALVMARNEGAGRASELATKEIAALRRRLGAEREVERLWEIHGALDEALGDSDIEDLEDGELRSASPLQWAAMKLAQMLEGSNPDSEAPESGDGHGRSRRRSA